MTISHHLDPSTVLRYAVGDFDDVFAITVATHLAMCGECREAVRLTERVGGALLESQGSEVSDGLFERLMSRIEAGDGEAIFARTSPATAFRDVPLPLVRHVGASLDSVRWRFVAPGVRQHVIRRDASSGSSLFMLKIDPGKEVPEHRHGGTEMTVILSGSYRDALGHFGVGDIADLDEHVEHQPKVDSDAPCICLVATEAPTQFQGRINQLVQRFVGI